LANATIGEKQRRVLVFNSADPDYFISHVDVTQIKEYRAEANEADRRGLHRPAVSSPHQRLSSGTPSRRNYRSKAGGLNGAEERIAATLNQVRKDVFRVARAQQALFAYVDIAAKALLTSVPEPPADARPRAVACAKERYRRLIKSAGRDMVGESKLAMADLVADLEHP
jgi:hypothetical protein